MPSPGDQARAEIALRLRAEGVDEATVLKQALARVQEQLAQLHTALGTQAIDWQEFRAVFPGLNTELGDAAARLREVQEAGLAQVGAVDKATAAVAKASAEINAMLGKDAAAQQAAIEKVAAARAKADAADEAEMERAHQKHRQFVDAWVAAEEEKERKRQEVIAATRRVEAVEGNTFKNREQEQLNALIEEGAQAGREAAAAHAGNARAAAVEANEIEHLGGVTVTMVSASTTSAAATQRQTKAYNDLASAAIETSARLTSFHGLVGGVGRSSVLTAQQLDQSRSATERAAYGFLHIAHAVQDAQYGFGAVLNNIPLVVQAIGGGPGLAGTVMIAGVAFEVLKGHIGDVSVALGMAISPMQGFARNTEDIKKKLEALEGKRWKVDVDYEDIRRARDQLEKLKEAEAAYEAAKKTKDKALLADKAKEVAEGAGGPDALSAAVLARSTGAGMEFAKQSDVDQARLLKGTIIPLWQRRLKEAFGFQKVAIQATLNKYNADLFALEETMRQANIDHAKQEAGSFLAGDVGAIARMKALVRENAKILPFGVAQAIRKMPGTPQEAIAKEQEKQIREAEAKADAAAREGDKAREERERAVREAAIQRHVAAFGAARSLGGDIEARTKGIVAEGEKDPLKIADAVRAGAIARVQAAGTVPEGLAPDVASRVIVPHVEKALGELVAGTAPGKDIVAVAKEQIAAGQAKADKPDIAREAARIGKEANDAIELSILEGASMNFSPDEIRRGMMGPLAGKMRKAGVAVDLAGDVAGKLFDEAMGRVRAELVARGGVNPRTAAMVAGERTAKAGRAAAPEMARGRREAVASELLARSGGYLTPEQADVGAAEFERLRGQGMNLARARATVGIHSDEFIRENIATLRQSVGMNAEMAMAFQRATMEIGMLRAQLSMTQGQMRKQGTRKGWPMPTIAPGAP